MAKITSIKKIIVEDYAAEARTTIQRLAQTLNPLLEQAPTAVNGQLTLRDNLKGKVYVVDLKSDVTTAFVAWPLNEKPTSVTIGALNKHNGDAPAVAFSLSWKYGTKNDITGIYLTFIGLAAATHHVATVIAQV